MTARQIFLTHVMKTGGVSLSNVLRSAFPNEATYPAADPTTPKIVAKTFRQPLLEMDPARRDALRLISVHQPAWVALAVAPDALKITSLREPVARTISHLRQISGTEDGPDDLEAVYADDGYRSRLANYQTQLFADTRTRNRDTIPLVREDLDEDARQAILHGLTQYWATGISDPMEVGPTEFSQAAATLEGYDCVGVTERLDEMVARVASLTGLDLPTVPHDNARKRSQPVSPELLAQITEDNPYDIQLYELACRLADRPIEERPTDR